MAISVTVPMTRNAAKKLKAGDSCLLTGVIYTARDAAHKRLCQLLQEGKAQVKVLSSADKWYGVTYAADKPLVVAALRELTASGKYPDGLWK